MSSIGIYGDSYGDNTHKKFNRESVEHGWPFLLGTALDCKVHNYSLCGSNRFYTLQKLQETLGQHEYNIIIHTYYTRTLYIEPEYNELAWYTPHYKHHSPKDMPEDLGQAYKGYYKYFYNIDALRIAAHGMNIEILKLLNERKISKDKTFHFFVDYEPDIAYPISNEINYSNLIGITSFNEFKDSVHFKLLASDDPRPCHMSWPNNQRVCDFLVDYFTGNLTTELKHFILSGDDAEVISNLEYLVEKWNYQKKETVG